MEETYTSVALWGNGEADTRAASALLEDFLPKKLGSVLRPESIGRGSLRAVINWIEGDDQLGENGTIASPDLLAGLLELSRTEGDEVLLVVLWPGAPTKEDIAFAESFLSEGIPVLDLCAALDELVITDEMREAADPTPVPEKPKRLTKAQKEEAARLEAESQAMVVLESEIAKAAKIAEDINSQVQEPLSETALLNAIREIVREEIRYALEIRDMEEGVPVPVTDAEKVEDLREEVTRLAKEERAKGRRGFAGAISVRFPEPTEFDPAKYSADGDPEGYGNYGPPFDGPYTDGALGYYMNDDGQYRRANGKPRRGETKVMLTPDEAAILRAAGQL
jgi:hypothetical protein